MPQSRLCLVQASCSVVDQQVVAVVHMCSPSAQQQVRHRCWWWVGWRPTKSKAAGALCLVVHHNIIDVTSMVLCVQVCCLNTPGTLPALLRKESLTLWLAGMGRCGA